MQLFIVYLGGKPRDGRMGEDHEIVPVVAEDIIAARKAAKAKSKLDAPHCDSVLDIESVDGFKITATAVAYTTGEPIVDNTWAP